MWNRIVNRNGRIRGYRSSWQRNSYNKQQQQLLKPSTYTGTGTSVHRNLVIVPQRQQQPGVNNQSFSFNTNGKNYCRSSSNTVATTQQRSIVQSSSKWFVGHQQPTGVVISHSRSSLVSPLLYQFQIPKIMMIQPSPQQLRHKHSQTQIKRLFKRHPARLRVEQRMWNIDRKQPRVILSETTTMNDDNADLNASTDEQSSTNGDTATTTTTTNTVSDDVLDTDSSSSSSVPSAQPQPLLYPPVYTIPTILPNGWFPPMDPSHRPVYPFQIRRTKNKPNDSIGFLPIYTKYRKDGTKVVTRIKTVTGDVTTFVRELRIVLSLPEPANQLQSYDAIRYRAGNMIEIQGHRAAEIRKWLGQLGF